MMRGIRDNGLVELRRFERRVRRSYAMGRISKADFEDLTHKVQELTRAVNKLKEAEEVH